MGKRAIAIPPTSRFSNRRIDKADVDVLISHLHLPCQLPLPRLGIWWRALRYRRDPTALQPDHDATNSSKVRPDTAGMLPSNAMDTTFKSLEVMDRLHNIQSPDYIQQPELLCLAGAWGSGTFAGVRYLPHLATTQILSLFTSVELV